MTLERGVCAVGVCAGAVSPFPRWTLWELRERDKKFDTKWADSQLPMVEFGTVEEFWEVWSHIPTVRYAGCAARGVGGRRQLSAGSAVVCVSVRVWAVGPCAATVAVCCVLWICECVDCIDGVCGVVPELRAVAAGRDDSCVGGWVFGAFS